MLELQLKDDKELLWLLDDLSRKFGFWTTLKTLLLAVIRRRRDAYALEHLDNRIRRDIGLPEKDAQPVVLWPFPFDFRS